MAKKKEEEKVQAFDPEAQEKVYSKKSYIGLVTEWEKYHKGTIFDEETGNEVSLEEFRRRHRVKKATELRRLIREDVKGKERDKDTVGKALIGLAKKGYMARHGIEDESVIKDKELFERNIKEYIIGAANRATEGRITTFEGAIAEVLSAPSPYNPTTERDQSRVLNALYEVISTDAHEESRKISELERSLADFYFTDHWHERHGDSIGKLDRREVVKAANPKFKKSARGAEIMATVKELYTTGEVSNLGADHIHYKGRKPTSS